MLVELHQEKRIDESLCPRVPLPIDESPISRPLSKLAARNYSEVSAFASTSAGNTPKPLW